MKQALQALIRNTVGALRAAPAPQAAPLRALAQEELRAVSGGGGRIELPKGTW